MRREAIGTRITVDPRVMGGRPCIRGLRVTVATIAGLLASGHSEAEVLELYPYLVGEDLRAVVQWEGRRKGGKGRKAVVPRGRGRG